ncbi:MAG: rRNA maturation RNase YbeY [Chthonomonadales bacterium]
MNCRRAPWELRSSGIESKASVIVKNALSRDIDITPLKRAAIRTLEAEGAESSEVSILLTDDAQLHELNLEYRSQDKPTDVLSFALRDHVANESFSPAAVTVEYLEPLGDVVISLETAERQAATHDRTLDQELCLLTVHGILHLLGYDDMTDEGAEEMQTRERALGVRR